MKYFGSLQFKRILKSIILVFLLQFASIGCIPNSKYLVSKEPVIIDQEELGSWKELEGKIIDINAENIVINLKEREYKNTEEKLRYSLKYKYAFRRRKNYEDQYSSIPLTSSERTKFLLSELSIIAGTSLGVGLALSGIFDVEEEEENVQYIMGDKKFGRAIMASLILPLGVGAYYILINKTTSGATPSETRKKIISEREKILINKPVKVWIKNSGFKKEYYTNSEGNLFIKKNEVLPYSQDKEAIALNISYQDKIVRIWIPEKFIKN